MSVYFENSKGRWRARIYVAGKQRQIGMFDTKLKATRAFNKAKRALENTTLNPLQVDSVRTENLLEDYPMEYQEIQPRKSLIKYGKAPKAFKPSLVDRAKRLLNKAKKSWQ